MTSIFEIWTEFWNLHASFEHRHRDFRVPVEISLVYRRYKAMNFPFHNSIKYFKNNIFFPIIFNLFLVFFGKISREMLNSPFKCLTFWKKNSNFHFIRGNTGHSWRGLTATASWIHWREISQVYMLKTSLTAINSLSYLNTDKAVNLWRTSTLSVKYGGKLTPLIRI